MLSFTRQFYQELLPGLKPAYVFIICAICSFLITDKDGERLMVWKSVQTKIIWELIYIFAGGLAAGTLIKGSGAADAIGKMVGEMNLTGGVATVFVIITLTLLLSDVTSNTATAAVAIPVGYGLKPKYMLKEGWKMTIIVIALMTVVCALMLKYWPAFRTV